MGYSFKKVCQNTLPVGTYKVQIADIKFKTSGTAVESYDMQVTYTVIEGPYTKRNVIDTIYEKSFSFRLMPFLKACGIDVDREFTTAKELYNYGIKEAKGKVLMLEVTTREYNGMLYNNVKGWSHLPGSSTSAAEVINEFASDELTPEAMPENPTVADTTSATPADAEPNLDFNLDGIDI